MGQSVVLIRNEEIYQRNIADDNKIKKRAPKTGIESTEKNIEAPKTGVAKFSTAFTCHLFVFGDL